MLKNLEMEYNDLQINKSKIILHYYSVIFDISTTRISAICCQD